MPGMAVIAITVYDEGRKHYEKFECESKSFLSSMRYFRDHVKSVQNTKDFQLSVYCDVSVFSWLISYIKNPDAQRLDDHNIIAILVSSSFLQMDKLVAECTKYISRRCCQLLSAGVELASVSDDLLRKVSQEIHVRDMEALWAAFCSSGSVDSDKVTFINKLYRLKMDNLLRTRNTAVLRCTSCGALFSAAHISQLHCSTDNAGLRLHKIDKDWKLRKHIQQLVAKGTQWRTIFWRVWSVVTVMYCFRCQHHFPAAEYYACGNGKAPCKTKSHHSVLPHSTQPQPSTAVTSASHIKASVQCIEDLRCLEAADGQFYLEPGNHDYTAITCSEPTALLQGHIHDEGDEGSEHSESSSEGNDSEDSVLDGESSAIAHAAAIRSIRDQPLDRVPTHGGMLSNIGSNLLQLQDFQKIADESTIDVSLRIQLCQEEDRRRMAILQSFLETFREEDYPPLSQAAAASPKRVMRAPSTRGRPRQVRNQTGRPQHTRRRDLHL
eukprot:jgi/Ulvmu1/6197/UM028_0053.1